MSFGVVLMLAYHSVVISYVERVAEDVAGVGGGRCDDGVRHVGHLAAHVSRLPPFTAVI